VKPGKLKWPKMLSTWMNACGYAWSMGQADWVFDREGFSVPAAFWCEAFRQSGDEQRATEMLAAMAADLGVNPQIHKCHAY
jgi:hypothetical protein